MTPEELNEAVDDAREADARNKELTELYNEVEMYREGLRDALAVIDRANKGAFHNGVTDPSGGIDEGDVKTYEEVERLRKLLDE